MSEYIETNGTEDANALLNSKLRQTFDGRIVRKDLTKKIKEGANVPVYVLEFLLGQYCSSDDPDVIEAGVTNVKRILAENYVRPDEAQKILSVLRQRGSYTVIDKITVNLNIKKDSYEAEFSNLGIKNIPISEAYPTKFDRLLCGGIWCIVQLEYEYIEEEKNASPIRIHKLTPIQMPHVDIEELKQGRKAFTPAEWMNILLRSIGMEPDKLNEREKWLLLARMLGAMGAFDPDEPDEVYQSSYVGSHGSNPFYAPKNNKYAWRLNCEDGSEYGISPEDYETRDEYHEALHQEKYAWRDYCEDGSEYGIDPEDYETEDEYQDALDEAKEAESSNDCDEEMETDFTVDEYEETALYDIDPIVASSGDASIFSVTDAFVPKDDYEDDDFHVFLYCKVETAQGTDYYRTENTLIKKGDTVSVPMNGQIMTGKVLSVERHMRFSAPKPVAETYSIID